MAATRTRERRLKTMEKRLGDCFRAYDKYRRTKNEDFREYALQNIRVLRKKNPELYKEFDLKVSEIEYRKGYKIE